MVVTPTVPGVYFEPRPREPEAPFVRTDVVGFIGFAPPGVSMGEPVRCDDWRDFLLAFGEAPDDGTFLAPAVRAFFMNGGGRAWVATVQRPDFGSPVELDRALREMIGEPGSSEVEATGLERLLLIDEVSIVDIPDLYARRASTQTRTVTLPASTEEACFRDCAELVPGGVQVAVGEQELSDPLYDDAQVFETQRRMLQRAMDERWRVLLLLTAPLEFDATAGRFRGPAVERALAWRQDFDALGESPERMSAAAFYFPWLLTQERVDAPLLEMPPTPFAAGVIARRDLARGPHVAPANESLRGVVALSPSLDDDLHGNLYEPPKNINVLRAFAGFGVQVWGARTLSAERWLRYLSVRRCLSAIERRVVAALQPLVFEPHTPLLWLQISQQVLSVLLPIFESGVLRGTRPEEAFYLRCDASVNPPEQIEAGVLVCEVGVAVAAPAEFIVFRVGRREGVVEVVE